MNLNPNNFEVSREPKTKSNANQFLTRNQAPPSLSLLIPLTPPSVSATVTIAAPENHHHLGHLS
ncbi:hypothetical protein Hanom_Chr02g00127801 [Helianthus anomalus]